MSRHEADDATQHSVADSSHPTDQQLIARIRIDDEHALSEVIHRYAAAMVSLVIPILGSHDLAQDVVQDVFCWLWSKRTTLDIHDTLFGYLSRATRNRAYSVLRHERSQLRLKDYVRASYGSVIPSARNLGDVTIRETELQSAIDAALATLQARTRQIFLMHVDHGLSYAEIAEALEITIPTVRMQMYRATSQLWKQLAEWFQS